jgi:hypothetical protein
MHRERVARRPRGPTPVGLREREQVRARVVAGRACAQHSRRRVNIAWWSACSSPSFDSNTEYEVLVDMGVVESELARAREGAHVELIELERRRDLNGT